MKMTEERRTELRVLVDLPLVGEDGNAFAIMGRAASAMRRAGFTSEEREEYQTEAMSGDYDHLLQTTMSYFDTSCDEEVEDESGSLGDLEEDCLCPNCS
jgi:hypothetical protein